MLYVDNEYLQYSELYCSLFTLVVRFLKSSIHRLGQSLLMHIACVIVNFEYCKKKVGEKTVRNLENKKDFYR